MRALPAEEKAKIAMLTESLKVEQSRLEREITQWDESGNDIIVLAKKMCMMMMEMSDFTRGQGPLKTTMDVIEGAKAGLPVFGRGGGDWDGGGLEGGWVRLSTF